MSTAPPSPSTSSSQAQPSSESEPVVSSAHPTNNNDNSEIPDNIRQIQTGIGQAKRYFTAIIEDVVKPSIKTFIETCDTNPRTAAIVATPALLAFLIVFTFFVLSTLVLVLWSCLTITIGVAFVIIGGVMSLIFKLLIVVVATIPLAGVATGLLVGANAASQFILKNLPTALPARPIDWTALADKLTVLGRQTAQGLQDARPVLLSVRDALVTLGLALHQALQTAMDGLHSSAEAAPPSEGVSHSGAPPSSEGVPFAQEGVDVGQQPAVVVEEEDSVVVEHTVLVDKSEELSDSAKGLKRRAPFPNVGDDEEHK